MRTKLAALVLVAAASGALRAEERRTIQVEVQPPGIVLDPSGAVAQQGLLVRELQRQALLLAAREELSLRTRDAALREPFAPVSSSCLTVSTKTLCLPAKETELSVTRAGNTQTCRVAGVPQHGKAPGDPDYPKLVAALEVASREQLPAILKALALEGSPAGEAATARPSERVLARLAVLTSTEQLGAARELHAALRQGQSVELLSALVRAYANLGVLTECHWSAEHTVFKARALLYAQRACTLSKDGALARWTRAYAYALAGLHAAGEAEAVAATALSNPPAWARGIEAYVRYDAASLRAVPAADEGAGVARLLAFLAVEHEHGTRIPLDVGFEALEKNPECYRIHDAINEHGGVSSQHRTTLLGLQILAKTLATRLAGQEALPVTVAKLATDGATVADLVKSLRSADDSGEPSWSVTGTLIEETVFDLARRRLIFMKEKWAVPVEEELGSLLAQLGPHRYRAYLESFGQRADTSAIEIADPEVRETRLMDATRAPAADPRKIRGERARIVALCQVDATAHELEETVRRFHGSGFERVAVERLQRASPRSPVLVEVALQGARPAAEALEAAPTWEKEHADHARVQRVLSVFYHQQRRDEDSRRCLDRAIALSPDRWCYETLAGLHEAAGDRVKWREALEKVLELPDTGLDHAQVRVRIARYYMGRSEWKEALPYADAAAETWAAWAMECAADCHEGARDMKGAELWMRRVGERYGGTRWYYWCVRTGEGDATAAKKVAEARFKAVRSGAPSSSGDWEALGAFYVLEGKRADALEWYARANKASPVPAWSLMTALLTDDSDERAGILTAVGERAGQFRGSDGRNRAATADLAKLMKRVFSKEETLDPAAVERIFTKASQKEKRYLGYIAGRFLIDQGFAKEARPLLEASASGPGPLEEIPQALSRRALEGLPAKKDGEAR